MSIFITAHFFGDVHAFGQEADHFVVNQVNLVAEFFQVSFKFTVAFLFPENQMIQDFAKRFRGNLLHRVGPGIVGVGMGLYHQPVHFQIHGLLRNLLYQRSVSADMAGVAQHWQPGHLPHQFNGNFPQGGIAVLCFFRLIKAPVNSCQAGDAVFVQPFNGSHPKFQVRIYRIFNHHRYIHSGQAFGQLLH